jgi:hypothetical protein
MSNQNTLENHTKPAEFDPVERPAIVAPGYTWSESSLRSFLKDLEGEAILADYYGKDAEPTDEQLDALGIDKPDRTDRLAGSLLQNYK